MLRPCAINVTPLDDFKLLVEFDNREKRIFNVAPYIKGLFYGELKDKCYFRRVKTNGYSIEWENGQDICPDELYYGSY